jgi:L-galactose dehydrogenase
MEQRTLGKTGLKVSALSFGTSSLGSAFRPIDEADGLRAVRVSLDGGINCLDSSAFYGLTKAETLLGKALRGVQRDSYVLITKCGRYGFEPKDFDFSARRVTASVDESLQRLGVDYVDVIMAHDIEFGDARQIIAETIPALRKVQKSGKARHVGVSGLPLKLFKRVAEAVDLDVIMSYCHYGLNDNSLADFIPFFKSKGIGVMSASPLAMRLLSHSETPDWHPAPPEVRQICALAVEYCRKRGENIERLALQYALANRDIATITVGSADPENMRRNITWAGEPMDRQLLMEVQEILEPIHNVTWPCGRPENNV